MGRRTVLLILFLLSLSRFALAALACDVSKLVSQADPQKSLAFWNKYAEAGAKGPVSDADVTRILKETGIAAGATAPAAGVPPAAAAAAATNGSAVPQIAYSFSKAATKDVGMLKSAGKQVRTSLDEFLNLAKQGAAMLQKNLRSNPGKWNFKELQDRPGVHSVRLNHDYRVGFKFVDPNKIEILGVNINGYH